MYKHSKSRRKAAAKSRRGRRLRPPSLPSLEPRRRRIHVIDIENLLGLQPRVASRFHYLLVAKGYRALVRPKQGEHIYVGCNHANAFLARDAFPKASLRLGHGPDGGERGLLELLSDVDFIGSRYAEVVIASGDHAFAPLAERLVEAGIPVTVVSRRNALSADLRRVASSVIAVEEIVPGAIPWRMSARETLGSPQRPQEVI